MVRINFASLYSVRMASYKFAEIELSNKPEIVTRNKQMVTVSDILSEIILLAIPLLREQTPEVPVFRDWWACNDSSVQSFNAESPNSSTKVTASKQVLGYLLTKFQTWWLIITSPLTTLLISIRKFKPGR